MSLLEAHFVLPEWYPEIQPKEFIIYWDDNLIVRCYSSTGREENVCSLEEDHPLYMEGETYWAGIMVLEVIQQARVKLEPYLPVANKGWAIDEWVAPSKVTDLNGQVLWSRREDVPDWRLMR